jgi:hypothetical protein
MCGEWEKSGVVVCIAWWVLFVIQGQISDRPQSLNPQDFFLSR